MIKPPIILIAKIRIDANESLDITRAIRLCKELEDYNIEKESTIDIHFRLIPNPVEIS